MDQNLEVLSDLGVLVPRYSLVIWYILKRDENFEIIFLLRHQKQEQI